MHENNKQLWAQNSRLQIVEPLLFVFQTVSIVQFMLHDCEFELTLHRARS